MARDSETFSATFKSLFWSSLMLIGNICTRQQFTAKGVDTLFLTHGAEDGWRIKAAFPDMSASAAMRQVNNWMQGIHQYQPDRTLMIAHNVLVSLSDSSSIVTYQDRQTAANLVAKIAAFHHPPSQTSPRTGQHPHVLAAAQSHWASRHFSSAVHRAYEALIVAVRDKSGRHELDGRDLMFQVFNEDKPMLLASANREEQKAIKFLFAGAIGAIRNPQAHTAAESLAEDETLEMLTICSYLFRVLDRSTVVQA